MKITDEYLDSMECFTLLRAALNKLVGRTEPAMDRIARNENVDVELLTAFVKRHFQSPTGITVTHFQEVRRKIEGLSADRDAKARGKSGHRLFKEEGEKDDEAAAPTVPKAEATSPTRMTRTRSASSEDAMLTTAPDDRMPGFEVILKLGASRAISDFACLNRAGFLMFCPRLLTWLVEHNKALKEKTKVTVLVNRTTQELGIRIGTEDGNVVTAVPGKASGRALKGRWKALEAIFPDGMKFTPVVHPGCDVLLRPLPKK